MLCSQCGVEATGQLCWNCGARLEADPAPAEQPAAHQPSAAPPPPGWSAEVRYQVLVSIPEVRDRLARQAALAPHRMSGEEFLGFADKVAGPLGVLKVPVAPVAKFVQPLYAQIGIKTGKTRAELVPWPVGRVIVAVLCSLARRGMTVASVKQAEDGCVVQAQIPSDWRSFAGTMVVTVARTGDGTSVEAGTKIGGQLFDWGKSAAFLRDLFADVTELSPAEVVG